MSIKGILNKVLWVIRIIERIAKAIPYILDGKHRDGGSNNTDA